MCLAQKPQGSDASEARTLKHSTTEPMRSQKNKKEPYLWQINH